jgi:D-alanine-D-alanine ligase
MSKTRVGVLRGGPSEEYDVSLLTGKAVLESIDRDSYEPVDVVITKAGEWLTDGRVRYPEHLLPTLDVVFNALHGKYGEDGTVQRLLERYSIPYTGSGPYASGVAMHKGYTKEHMRDVPVLLAEHMILEHDPYKPAAKVAGEIRERFGPQYVIKPVSSGSSVGVILVLDTLDLANALERAFTEYDEVIVEEYIPGKEVTCGVIERFRDHAIYPLPPILILPPDHATFFDSTVKYDGTTQELCPAPLSSSDKKFIEEASIQVHRTLNLAQYSRSDFILSNKGLYFLEVNTLPGLTKESLIPKALQAVGSSHSALVNHLIHDAYTKKGKSRGTLHI